MAVLWLLLTLAGEALVFGLNPFPLAAAEEAAIVDDAFRVLMVLATPVFTFVLATLAYSVFRFRRKGEPVEDGPPVRSHKGVLGTWFFATTALTLLVIVFPGLTGLLELRDLASQEPDLVVQVEAGRWFWRVTYPEYGVTSTKEMVLPVGKRVRFEVTSMDVLHAFWVSAFRVKIDAVPGLVTTTSASPNRTGTFEDDSGFRLQCAELCGLGHSIMDVPIRVVEPSQFEAWVAQQAS